MYNEDQFGPEEEMPLRGALKVSTGSATKLPSVPTTIGKQDRLLGGLNEVLIELSTRLQPISRAMNEPLSKEMLSDKQAPSPALVEVLESHNQRIAQMREYVQMIISKLEI